MMKVNQEINKGMGYMCCGPWMRGSHSGFRLTIGFMLILIGSLWLGARMGWIDVTWFYKIPVLPLVVVIIGICLVYKGLNARKATESQNGKEV